MKQNIRIFIARYKFIWLLTSMILLTLSAQAQQANHEKVLQQLDEVITKKASFRTERETTISQLKQQLHYATTVEDSINYVMNYSDYIYIIKQTQLCII